MARGGGCVDVYNPVQSIERFVIHRPVLRFGLLIDNCSFYYGGIIYVGL